MESCKEGKEDFSLNEEQHTGFEVVKYSEGTQWAASIWPNWKAPYTTKETG